MAARALVRRYKSDPFGAARGRVQTLLFPRDWPIRDALTWAALNDFDASDYDVTDSHVRVFQTRKKGKARHVRTIPYGPVGIRAVVEWR